MPSRSENERTSYSFFEPDGYMCGVTISLPVAQPEKLRIGGWHAFEK
jgi:hypothetical protein